MTLRRILAVGLLVSGTAAPLSGQDTIPSELDGRSYSRLSGQRATVHFSSPDSLVAREVLALLDGQLPLPGLPAALPAGVDAVLAHSPDAFDVAIGGYVPEWRAGAAVPSRNLLVMPTGERQRILDPEGRRTLRHEWAHLGLAAAVGGMRAPRWFDEGYAQWASGGFDATQAWKLRIQFATGDAPSLDSLTLRWPSARAQAETAYLLSASAITYLLGESGARGMEVFLERWNQERSFDSAFRTTFGVTPGQFEEDWRKHVKDRYGWLFLMSHSAVFWGVVALVLLSLVYIRDGRNREKMARLRAGELPDLPAFWIEVPEADGPDDPPDGV